MKKIILVLIFFTSLLPLSYSLNGELITKNHPLSKHAVLLKFRRDGMSQSCTGSLISQNFVLTAAHCLDGKVKRLSVHFPFSKKRKKISSTKFQIHEMYLTKDYGHQVYAYDIGLLKLNKDAPNDYPIISLAQETIEKGEPVFSIGFGGTSIKKKTRGDTTIMKAIDYGKLRGSKFSILDVIEARDDNIKLVFDNIELYELYKEKGYIPNRTYVIGDEEEKAGLCMGDSGGPSFVRDEYTGEFVQIGITSNGILSRQCNTEMNVLNIIGLKSWIDRSVESLSLQ